MRALNNISVRVKILVAVAATTFISVALGLYCLREAATINARAMEIRDNWLPSVSKLGQLSFHVRTLRARQNRLAAISYHEPAKLGEVRKLTMQTVADIDAAYAAYKPMITPNTLDEKLMAEFARVWPKAKELNEKALNLL